MIYLRISIFVLICFFSFNFYGQNTNSQTVKEKKNAIIFSPFNLLDPINPSFQLGYQRLLNDKFELQLEYGHIINKALFYYIINPNEGKDEYSNDGFKFRLELKRYLHKNEFFGLYLSGELFYLENVSKVQNQFIVSDPNYDYSFDLPNDGEKYGYTDYFTNSKTKYCFNAKIGLKVNLDPLFIETYLGLGLAYRNNIHSERENLNDLPYDTSFLNDNIPKKMFLPNIPFNLKIGYKF